MKNLYLDDIRMPPNDREWNIVRSYGEAQAWIERCGMPDHISFDHDLGEELTGYDFAKWLIALDESGAAKFPEKFSWNIHSANPVGAKNIRELLNGYADYCRRMA